MNILIVEDNADDRRLLRNTLEHHGCTVIEARDGEEGLDLAFHHLPDIIISDVIMPRMDGFQLLRALKADLYLKSIPFLFYSATYTGEQEEKLALSLGAEAFVVKSTEPEELWDKTCAIMKAWEARQRIPAHLSIVESELFLNPGKHEGNYKTFQTNTSPHKNEQNKSFPEPSHHIPPFSSFRQKPVGYSAFSMIIACPTPPHIVTKPLSRSPTGIS